LPCCTVKLVPAARDARLDDDACGLDLLSERGFELDRALDARLARLSRLLVIALLPAWRIEGAEDALSADSSFLFIAGKSADVGGRGAAGTAGDALRALACTMRRYL
jgi:hypothetical protein